MIIKSIGISGFRSFVEPYEFKLQDGFNLMLGDNVDEPHKGGNGVGKSSLWDAACWAIYGKTCRGLRASGVTSYGAKSTVVDIRFVSGADEFILSRSRNPTKTTLNGEEVEQEELERAVGLNYEQFLNTILLGQFNEYFLDMTATEKLNLLSSVFDFDSWLAAADRAKCDVRSLRDDLAKCDLAVNRTEGSIESAQAALESQGRRAAEFNATRKEEAQELTDAIERIKAEGRKLKVTRENSKRVLSDLEEKLDSREDEKSKLESDARESRDKVSSVRADIRSAKDELRDIKARIESVDHRKGEPCLSCGQTITPEHAEKYREQMQANLEFLDAEITMMEIKESKLLDSLAEFDAQIKKAAENIGNLRDGIKDAQRKVDMQSVELKQLVRELNGNRESLERLECRSNPHEAEVVKLKDQISKYQGKLRSAKREKVKLGGSLARAEFWASEFKAVRLWLIERVLAQLEVTVNNAAEAMGLKGWRIAFDSERETHAGKVSKGFSVLIDAPGADQQQPWEAWSGGETQRLRLAGAVGLASLIADYRGLDASTEIWDEPTQYLSAEGIDDLITFLCDRQNQRGGGLWLVDHRMLEYGDFDNVYAAVRRDGTTIIEERQ